MRDFIYFMMQSGLLICLVLLLTRFGKRFLSARTGYCLWLIPLMRLCLPFFLVPVTVPAVLGSLHPYALARDVAAHVEETVGNMVGAEMQTAWEPSSEPGIAQEKTPGGGAGRAGEADGKTPEVNPQTEARMNAVGKGGDGAASAETGAAGNGPEDVNAAPSGEICTMKPEQRFGVSAGRLAALIWAAGCLVTGGILFYHNIRFFRWVKKDAKRAEPLEDFAACAEKKERPLPVYYKKELPSPCLAGVLHPVIFVNERAVRDPAVLKMVLLHERAHFQQKDHIWNFCRNMLCVLYWFHPFVWWGAVASTRDAELACDERVVRGMCREERRQYGNALLELLEGSCGKKKVLDAATAMTGGKKEMKERIFTIVKQRGTKRGALAAMLVLLLVTGVVGCTRAQDGTETRNGTEAWNGTEARNGTEAQDGTEARNDTEMQVGAEAADDAAGRVFSLSGEDGSIQLFTSGKTLGAYRRGAGGAGSLTFYDADFHAAEEYENVRLEEFSDDYYCLLDLNTGLYGYVDDSGKLVIPFSYPLAKGFHNGYAAVLDGARQEIYYEDQTVKMYDNVDGCWGIIDKRGNYVIEPDEAFSNSFDRKDLGEASERYVNGPVEFTQVGEDGHVEFVVRETGQVLMEGYIVVQP